MTRLARGSLPWPRRTTSRPAALGILTVEAPLAAGAKLRVTAWPRLAPDGHTMARDRAHALSARRSGRPAVALTETTAAIQNPTGAITTYRRHNKPALGPVGDSLDDLEASFGGSAA